MLPLNKPFFVISDPAFTWQINEETVRWRNWSTAVSSDGQKVNILVLPQVSFSADGERINQLTPTILFLRKIHEGVEHFEHFEPNRCRLESLPATKNHRGVLWDSENESDAWICSVPDFETRLQSPPRNPLELMPRQQQQENADKVLVENNFDRDVTERSKVSAVFLQLQCASAQLKLFSMTRTWTLFKLCD